MQDAQIGAVLDFWFDGPLAEAAPAHLSPRWFRSDPGFDAQIGERFGALVETALDGALETWAGSPEGRLALLILLDQFPRNLYRGTARAFAGDERARQLALEGIERGDDRRLPPLARLFCYLPLEHAEDRTLQDCCVALFEALQGEVDDGVRDAFAGFTDYARRHREVIERFGRFPHRNAALGRPSSDAERDYLAQPGAGF